jgi:hypothetical protein
MWKLLAFILKGKSLAQALLLVMPAWEPISLVIFDQWLGLVSGQCCKPQL